MNSTTQKLDIYNYHEKEHNITLYVSNKQTKL